MGYLDNFIHHASRHDHRSVVVAHNRVARAHQDSSALNRVVNLPRPELGGALFGRRAGRVHREPVFFEDYAVPRSAISHQAAGLSLHHSHELDVAADGTVLPSHRVDHQHLSRTAQLDGDILRRLIAFRFVRSQIRPVRHKSERDSPPGHVLAFLEGHCVFDVAHGPAFYP